MTTQRFRIETGCNIVLIPDLPKLIDPLHLNAQQLVDLVHSGRLIGMIPPPYRAVQDRLESTRPVGKKNLPPATRMEPPTAGPLADSERN